MVVVLVIVFVFLARAAWGMYYTYRLSADRLDEAKSQLDGVKSQEQGLSQSIAELSTPAGVDAALRSNFRVTKPGESLAVIIPSTAATSTPTSTPQGLWARIVGWFETL